MGKSIESESVIKQMDKILKKIGNYEKYIENVISLFNHADKILKSNCKLKENMLKILFRL